MLAIVICASNFLLIASIWAVAALFHRRFRDIEARAREDFAAAIRAVVEAPQEGQPSALAVYTDQLATIFAARIIQQLKAGAAGIASGAAKQAEGEAMGQLAGQSPWLALAAGLLPKKFRNALMSAPQFTGALKSGQGDNHNSKSDVQERLKFQ